MPRIVQRPLGRPLSHKRVTEIYKSYDEMDNRLLIKTWRFNQSLDWELRLAALLTFQPQLSCRQVLNLAKLNTVEK